MLLGKLQFRRVLDRHDSLRLRQQPAEYIQEGGLAARCAARDHDIPAARDRDLQELENTLGEASHGDQLFKGKRIAGKLAYRKDRPLQGKRRNDGVDPGAVLQSRVHHGHAFVDPSAQGADDTLDDPEERLLARKGAVGEIKLPADLDEDLVLPVDHDLRNLLVLDQILDRPQPQHLIEHLLVEVFPIHVVRDRIPHGVHDAPDGTARRSTEFGILDTLQVHPPEIQEGDQPPVNLLFDRNQALVVTIAGRLENIPVAFPVGGLPARPLRDHAQAVAPEGDRVSFFQNPASLDARPVDERAGPALQVYDFRQSVLDTQLEMPSGEGRLIQDDIVRGRGPDKDLGFPHFVFGRGPVLAVAHMETHSRWPPLSQGASGFPVEVPRSQHPGVNQRRRASSSSPPHRIPSRCSATSPGSSPTRGSSGSR